MARDITKTKLELAPHQIVLRPLVTEKGFKPVFYSHGFLGNTVWEK